MCRGIGGCSEFGEDSLGKQGTTFVDVMINIQRFDQKKYQDCCYGNRSNVHRIKHLMQTDLELCCACTLGYGFPVPLQCFIVESGSKAFRRCHLRKKIKIQLQRTSLTVLRRTKTFLKMVIMWWTNCGPMAMTPQNQGSILFVYCL